MALKKILIIEDDQLSLELLVQLLDGYKVLTATDGSVGLQSVRENKPDLVLLDISLPILDGFEVAKRIKEDSEISKTVVIGISSRAMKEDIENAISSGFDDYLTKPLNEEELFEKLNRYLNDEPRTS